MKITIDDSETFLDELAEMVENMGFQITQTHPANEIRLATLENCIRQWREDLIFIYEDLTGFNIWDEKIDYTTDWEVED